MATLTLEQLLAAKNKIPAVSQFGTQIANPVVPATNTPTNTNIPDITSLPYTTNTPVSKPVSTTKSIKDLTPVETIVAPGITGLSADELKLQQMQQAELDRQAALSTQEAEDEQRRQIQNMFQSEIDALNGQYAINRAEAARLGMGKLGTDTAIQARRGLIGSSFGEAETRNVERENAADMNKVQADYQAQLSAINTRLMKDINDMKKEKATARSTSAEAYIANQRSRVERQAKIATDHIASVIASKYKPTDKDFTDWAKAIGVDPTKLKNEYDTTKLNADKAAKTAELAQKKLIADLDKLADERIKSKADLSKPYEVGGFMYQYDPMTQSAKQIGEARSVNTNVSSADLKADINKMIATDEFQKMSDDDKKLYILSQGGNPTDYSY